MRVYYDTHNRRLVYIGEASTPDFWDNHWETESIRRKVKENKNIRFVLRTLAKYIPDKKGKILEGGCGIGGVVYCMHSHGYECLGIDFAKKTVKYVKEVMPELDIIPGDVRNLPFRDSHFVGYWSLGVVEHFWNGYYDVLEEMRRVLADGGYIFMSIPYMSPLRRLKAKLGFYKEFSGKDKEKFYQFALPPEAIIRDFQAMGFRLMEKKPKDGLKGLKDEIKFLKPLLQKLYDYRGNNLWFKGLRFMLSEALAALGMGHIMFFVFRKY